MVGSNIQKARLELKMSRHDLGKAVGVTSDAIGLYENGKREPGAFTIHRLCTALSVSPNTLLRRGK